MTGPKPTDKKCSRCKEVLPRGSFYRNSSSPSGLSSYCKVCNADYTREKRKRNPDQYTEQQLQYGYGISLETFNEMYKKQDGSCAICKSKPDYRLCIDHRHDTGKVRGLLCRTCNKAIGQLGDTPESVYKAYVYLKETHEED